MGNSLTFFQKTEPIKALILGLDCAGKTTLLYKMNLGEVVTTLPTIGLSVENINHKQIEIISWDVSGRQKLRPLLKHYFTGTQILIYVIDSNDKVQISEVKSELFKFLTEDELRDCAVLVIANKQDLTNAMSVNEIRKLIEFDNIKQEPKHIIGASALTGDGIREAFDWIAVNLSKGKISSFLTDPVYETVTDMKKITKFETWSQYFKSFSSK